MITGSLKNQVDRVWDTFWSGGISNPMDVIEQFTYLLFIRQLDERQNELDQKKLLGVPVHDEEIIFTTEQEDLRWKNLMQIGDPTELHHTMAARVFPFLKTMVTSTLATSFQDASFGISSPSTLQKAMELINNLDIKNRDIAGDLYEYMLSKLATSKINGQFRTPQHIIDLLVELMVPQLGEKIIDPACGTAGFLINASKWMKRIYREELYNANERERFYSDTFTGYDFDRTMVRIAMMNSYIHGFDVPHVSYRDSLSELPLGEQGAYDVILANPPFSGSLDVERVDPVLNKQVNTKKTELLFLARFLTLLKVGGRAAVIVPQGVLFNADNAYKTLRKELVENQKLDAVINLPSGVFRPYSGVSTAVLCFTKTDSGGTDEVWFYDMFADGLSLDDKRTLLLPENLLGPAPHEPFTMDNQFRDPVPVQLTDEQLMKNNLPDLLTRFHNRNTTERDRTRTEQSFTVHIDDIRAMDYGLSMDLYRKVISDDEEIYDLQDILDKITELDKKIVGMLSSIHDISRGDQQSMQHSLVVGSDFMNDWEVRKLGNICSISIGKTPARKESRYWGGVGLPWLSIKDMNQGTLISKTKEKITQAALSELKITPYPVGTLLFSFKLSIGKVGITTIPLFTNEAIAAIEPKENIALDKHYLMEALRHVSQTIKGNAAAKGVTLNKKSLSEIIIPVPPYEEQKRIAAILGGVTRAIESTKVKKLSLLQELQKSLATRAFAGLL